MKLLPLLWHAKREPRMLGGGSSPFLRTTVATPTFFQSHETFVQGKQVCQTIVDATTSGNESRFFNHCCDPNLSVFVVSACRERGS